VKLIPLYHSSSTGKHQQQEKNPHPEKAPMSLSPNLTLLLAGAGIGFGCALVGAVTEYWFSLRGNGNRPQRRLPGCLFYIAGGLALAGVIAVVVSLFVIGDIRPALTLGAGLFGGFFLGFVLFFSVWLLWS
jgi:hypothetical protein